MEGNIPTEADWRSERWCLDAEHAYWNFVGKSHDEAVALFKDNAIRYQEDVVFMPSACFPFYCRAYMAYLMSPDSKNDSDGASCFFTLVDCRLDEIRADKTLKAEVIACLKHIATRQAFYEADVGIYGAFAERAKDAIGQIRARRTREMIAMDKMPIGIAPLRLYPHYLEAAAAWIVDQWHTSTEEECRATLVESPDRPGALAAIADGCVIGVLGFKRYPTPEDGAEELWINALLVVERWRGRGAGSKLLHAGVEAARAFGFERLYVYTDVPKFFERHGWRQIRHNEGTGMFVLEYPNVSASGDH